jgi:hypothetical protein
MALAQNFEEYIKTRQKQWIIISPYEEVFLNCEIPYSEREEIVIDFLTNLEDTQNIDFIDLTYSNPRFWDCIIPYPDKKNLAKVVPDSFDSNKLLAEQLSWEYVWPEVSEEFINLAKMQNELILEHQKVIDKLTEDYNIWLITSDELNEKIAEERNKLDEAIQNLIAENDKVKEQIITQIDEWWKNLDTSWMIPSNNINNSKVVIICVAVVLILLWLITMFYVVKKGKTKQE